MRVGIAHHFGWAVAVVASSSEQVVDRRRIDLVEPGVPVAPVHGLSHSSAVLSDDEVVALVARVRASSARAVASALDDLPGPIVSMSLRAWPPDFPADVATQRKVPYEARADSVMYRQVLAEAARERGWEVHLFEARDVQSRAVALAGNVLDAPRAVFGAPWGKDHRMAFAATILANRLATPGQSSG
ncbi:hypothetical protein [Cryptosporangium phraense]|uniref:Uncharacterized protein n=1 Tax=Cryptosporangium phraense TaxID=2593070 RepID=A0A545AKV2_9ACTN|nr:hypothetical protein [Cryptosporangium phraense]TQS41911.1 hypothetical protein FL583_26885 [Cryptosporangium phraense]